MAFHEAGIEERIYKLALALYREAKGIGQHPECDDPGYRNCTACDQIVRDTIGRQLWDKLEGSGYWGFSAEPWEVEFE